MIKKINKLKIILIDDDDDFREAISSILKNDGNHVVDINGSKNLDQVLKESGFDVAIVDYFLPYENGIDIVKRIRSTEGSKNAKILMISSHENIRALVTSSGIKNFISKPLDPDELIKKIATLN